MVFVLTYTKVTERKGYLKVVVLGNKIHKYFTAQEKCHKAQSHLRAEEVCVCVWLIVPINFVHRFVKDFSHHRTPLSVISALGLANEQESFVFNF